MSIGPDAMKFFDKFGAKLLERVEMNFIAEIKSFNASAYTANILPLLFANNESGNGQRVQASVLNNVPVERLPGIKHKYKTGDLVTVKCFASSIQQPLKGSPANLQKSRFQFTSCVVSGAVKLKTPETSFLTLDGDEATFSGTLRINGQLYVNGKLFELHTHTGVVPGGGTTGPVGP